MHKDLFSIGVSAYLTPGGSVHREGFVQAVNMAIEKHADDPEMGSRLLWEDDGASFAGGGLAAQHLVKRRASVVIGHYATAAAAGALPVYREAGIPLLLPASTADLLTVDFENAFRLCRRDHDLAEYICNITHYLSGSTHVAVVHDESIHGRCLSGALEKSLAARNRLGNLATRYDAVVFAGTYGSSIDFLHEYQSRRPFCPLYFTDDAVHEDIAVHVRGFEQELYIAGYAPAYWYTGAQQVIDDYRRCTGTYPPTYFLETYAAVQIALACRAVVKNRLAEVLSGREWPTVLGNIRFVHGESNCSRFACWQVGQEGLQPLKNIPAYA